MPSDGSHLGSASANSIGLDSIGDPLADGLSDQDQQERGGEGLNLATEMEILGPEFGSEDPIVNMDANDEEGNDRDSADYSTTIRTNRYYLRIFCWALDRVIHAAYVVVCFLIKSDIGQKEWKRYLDGHSGRHDFQIDLALSLMNYGIGLQWDGESAERPNFMRQDPFVPCDCGKCFFA